MTFSCARWLHYITWIVSPRIPCCIAEDAWRVISDCLLFHWHPWKQHLHKWELGKGLWLSSGKYTLYPGSPRFNPCFLPLKGSWVKCLERLFSAWGPVKLLLVRTGNSELDGWLNIRLLHVYIWDISYAQAASGVVRSSIWGGRQCQQLPPPHK